MKTHSGCKQIVAAASLMTAIGWPTLTQAAVIYVPDNYATIQAAVTAAAANDTIYVRPGTYNETVDINPPRNGLTLEGLEVLGARPTFPMAVSSDAIRVNGVNDVVIRGFDIYKRKKGIQLDGCLRGLVDQNHITFTKDPIRVIDGSANIVDGNTVTDGSLNAGIRVQDSDGTAVRYNVVQRTKDAAIYVIGATNVEIYYNNTSDANDYGVRTSHADNVIVFGNIADGNDFNGIFVQTSDGATVQENNADNNLKYGFYVQNSAGINTIADLVAANNTATGNVVADFRVN